MSTNHTDQKPAEQTAAEAAKRPWRVDDTGAFIQSPDELIVAMVIQDNYEANAAHIVKCVNMHDGLVAACEAVPMFYEAYSEEWQRRWERLTGGAEAHTKGLCDFVRSALAKAKPSMGQETPLPSDG